VDACIDMVQSQIEQDMLKRWRDKWTNILQQES
jgi:hypothetical protein